MGIEAEAEKLRSVMKPSPTVRRKRPAHSTPLERRESTRTKSGSVNYAESDIDDFFGTERYGLVFCHQLDVYVFQHTGQQNQETPSIWQTCMCSETLALVKPDIFVSSE
jgi:hypothetical protein